MMRLGSLAGYPFEGPRLLAGWTPPAAPAVFAVMYRPRPEHKPEEYAVLYVGHSDDLSTEGFPFDHPDAPCWLLRVRRDRFALHVCTYEAPGATRAHREHIARELMAVYRPGCNTQRYDQAWKDEWIGQYQAPTTGPLTTCRRPPSHD